MSNNYLDDVFTIKDLLGLEKDNQKYTLIENLVFLVLFQVPHLR